MNNELRDLYTLFIAQVRRNLQAATPVVVWCPLAEWEAAAEQWGEDEGPCAATPRYVLGVDATQPPSKSWQKVPGVEQLREVLQGAANGQGFFPFGSAKALAIERGALYALLHWADWRWFQTLCWRQCMDIWWTVRAGRLTHAINTICLIHHSVCARRNRKDRSGRADGRWSSNLPTSSIVRAGAGRSSPRRSRWTRRPTRRATRATRGARQCSSGIS